MKLSPSRAIAIAAVLAALVIGFFAGKLKSDAWVDKGEPSKPTANTARQPQATASQFTPETKRFRNAEPAARTESQALMQIRQYARERHTGPLLMTVSKFEAGEFLAVWSILDELPEDPFYEEVKGRALLRAAQLEDLSVILKAISETHGTGNVRNAHYQKAFSYSKESLDQLATKAAALNNKGEQDAALRGMARNLSLISDLSKFDMLAFARDAPLDVSQVIKEGLGNYPVSQFTGLDDATLEKRVMDALSTAKSLGGEGSFSGEFVHEVASGMSPDLPFKVWPLIERFYPDVASDPAVATPFLNEMIRQDGLKALGVVTHFPDIGQDRLAAAASNAMSKDSSKMESWYEANHAGLEASHASAIAGGAAEYSAKSGDAETADTWLNRIQDPAYRQAVEGRIAEIQKARENR